jgi:hypothetical protein
MFACIQIEYAKIETDNSSAWKMSLSQLKLYYLLTIVPGYLALYRTILVLPRAVWGIVVITLLVLV